MGAAAQREDTCGGITVPGPCVFPGPWLLFPCSQTGERCLESCSSLGGSTDLHIHQYLSRGGWMAFETQALEMKGSDDWYEIRLWLLSDSFVRQRPSWVNHLHVCVTVITAVLNINVKGYWAAGINQTLLACGYQTGLHLRCVLLSLVWRLLWSMGSSCRNSNLSQEYRLYFHTQIWHIHTLDLFLLVLSKLYQWRERERFALTVFLR